MKRFLSTAASALLILSLTSCASDKSSEISVQETQTTEPVTQTMIAADLTSDADLSNTLQSMISSYNAYNPQHIDYISYNGDIAALDADIAAGNMPDIFIAQPYQMLQLKNKNYLADLSPLLEQDKDISKNDFLPNVISSLETNGRLESIYCGFRLSTVAAKSYRTTEDMINWSYDEAIAAGESLYSGNKLVYEYNSREMMSLFMLKNISRDCIDFNRKKCDFSALLPPALRYLKTFPNESSFSSSLLEMSEDEKKEYNNNARLELINDRALVNTIDINGINWYYSLNAYVNFGGAYITYLGYPSKNGTGTYSAVDTMFAVSDTSQFKTESWQLLRDFFTEENQTQMGLNNNGIPVIEKVLDKLAYDTPADTQFSIRENISFNGQDQVISDEAVDQLVELVKGAEIDPWTRTDIDSIINEEILSAFNGDKTPEQCAEALNEKISAILAPPIENDPEV